MSNPQNKIQRMWFSVSPERIVEFAQVLEEYSIMSMLVGKDNHSQHQDKVEVLVKYKEYQKDGIYRLLEIADRIG